MFKILRKKRDIFRDIVKDFIVIYQKIERYRLKRNLIKKLLN